MYSSESFGDGDLEEPSWHPSSQRPSFQYLDLCLFDVLDLLGMLLLNQRG